jgi:hypothetical protein
MNDSIFFHKPVCSPWPRKYRQATGVTVMLTPVRNEHRDADGEGERGEQLLRQAGEQEHGKQHGHHRERRG